MDKNDQRAVDASQCNEFQANDVTKANPTEEAPSSFPRVPDLPPPSLPHLPSAPAEPEPFARPFKRSKKAPKFEVATSNVPLVVDPTDPDAVTRANLAAAPVVGVVGYGPGTGGGSGIRRHTPSCDFCKRRKERCIGGPPCQACDNRDIPCTFNSVNKSHFDRKRPRSKPSEYEGGDTDAPGTSNALSASNTEPTQEEGQPVAGPSTQTMKGERTAKPYKKRGKVSEMACHFCRDRRKKCSGELPSCSNCHRRAVQCVYPEEPRARRGGRKKKEPDIDQSSLSPKEPTIANIPISQLPGLPGMLFPMPFLSPASCHFCRDQELPCDRSIPICTHCHRRSQSCVYDAFTPDISNLGLWPATMPLPPLPFPPQMQLQIINPMSMTSPQNMTPGVNPIPFFDVSWMAHLAELQLQATQSQGQGNGTGVQQQPPTGNPLIAMQPQLLAMQLSSGSAPGSTTSANKPASAGSIQPQLVYPTSNPSLTSPFSSLQGSSPSFLSTAEPFGPQALSPAAAVAQNEPVVERSGPMADTRRSLSPRAGEGLGTEEDLDPNELGGGPRVV